MNQSTAYPQFFDFSTPASASASASEPVSVSNDFITSEWLNDGGDLPSQPAQNSPDFITSEWLNESFLDWPCSSNTFASSTSQSPTDLNPLPQIQTRPLFDSNQEHRYSSGNDLFSAVSSKNETFFFRSVFELDSST